MAITGSPAVIVQEQDLSSYVSADSVTTGAVVGNFEWGPVGAITKITSEGKLVEFFGKPYDWNYKDWFTAKNFLQYSSSLAVVRAISEGALNASAIMHYNKEKGVLSALGGNGFLLENDAKQEEVVFPAEVGILARYPGLFGNSLRVSILNDLGMKDELDSIDRLGLTKHIDNGYYVYKDSAGTVKSLNKALNYTSSLRKLDEDEILVVVTRTLPDGKEELLEYGIYSINDGSTDVTGYGNYVFKYFNNNSNWIYLIEKNFPFFDEEGERVNINIDVTLTGGCSSDLEEGDKDYYSLDIGDYQDAWDLFANEETEEAEVQLLMQGGAPREVGQYIIQIAETRKDCLACVSPDQEEVLHKKDAVARMIATTGTGYFYSKSSYAFMDGNYKYQYDNYNDVYRWLPLNGDIAGIMAQIDSDEDPWMSPGGKQIKNCVKLAFHPTKAERDDLFANNINPVTNFRAEGNILWGDWTRVDNTAFNFVGVRRLFLYVERAIKDYARTVMWKQNDELTERLFVMSVEPFLNNIVGGRGIQEFKVYAGASVTSPDEMDKGIFRAKILIKPVRSIRYVALVFTAVRSDMSIDEVVQ